MSSEVTIWSVLQDRMRTEDLVLESGKRYGTFEDLTDQIFDYSVLRELPTFPTCFYVLPTSYCKYRCTIPLHIPSHRVTSSLKVSSSSETTRFLT
jgi:hypothetical protein